MQRVNIAWFGNCNFSVFSPHQAMLEKRKIDLPGFSVQRVHLQARSDNPEKTHTSQRGLVARGVSYISGAVPWDGAGEVVAGVLESAVKSGIEPLTFGRVGPFPRSGPIRTTIAQAALYASPRTPPRPVSLPPWSACTTSRQSNLSRPKNKTALSFPEEKPGNLLIWGADSGPSAVSAGPTGCFR